MEKLESDIFIISLKRHCKKRVYRDNLLFTLNESACTLISSSNITSLLRMSTTEYESQFINTIIHKYKQHCLLQY